MTDAGAGRPRGEADAARHERRDAMLDEQVAPKLAALRAKQLRYRLRALLGGLGGPALAWLLFETGDTSPFGWGVVAAMIGLGAAFHLADRYRKAARDLALPVACAATGGITRRDDVGGGPVARLRREARRPLRRGRTRRRVRGHA
jgi:hypothetical protein